MPLTQQSSVALSVGRESKLGNQPADEGDKVCWVEMKRYPYHPDHQVELLHLQAEADALIIRLQAVGRKDTQRQT